jgi:hypothetical protein
MTDDDGIFNLDSLSDNTARDILRRAAAEARNGPVWITENGQRIAAIVSPLVVRARPWGGFTEAEVNAYIRSVHTGNQAKYGTGCGSEILRQQGRPDAPDA